MHETFDATLTELLEEMQRQGVLASWVLRHCYLEASEDLNNIVLDMLDRESIEEEDEEHTS